MQVVILAGGLGTRLRASVPNVPKSLVPVAGKPFIEHQLGLLRSCGLLDVLICIGHQGELIEKHLGDGSEFGLRVRYSHEDAGRLLGTGGALVNALPLLGETFLVMYGDSYLPIDYRAVCDAFRRADARALMCVYRNEGRWDRSNVRMAGDKVAFYSKTAAAGEADCIDYGLMAFRRCVFEAYSTAPPPLDLASILSDIVADGDLRGFLVSERFYEIGKPEGLAELDALLRRGVGRQ